MEINICGVKYTIVQVNEVDNDPSCLGLCIYRETLIQIKRDYRLNEKASFSA